MKKTKLSLILSGLIIVGAIAVSSCKKKETTTTTPDTSTTSASDNNTAQQHAHDLTNIGSEGIENNNGSLSTYRLSNGGSLLTPMSGSVNVNINTTNKTMDVTFYNCLCSDHRTRNGLVHYDWSQSTGGAVWYRDSGLVLNITTPGNTYSVDGYTVQVNSKQIKNIGRVNNSGNLQLTWTDNSNITVVKPGGANIQWQGNWSIALLNTASYNYTNYDGTTSTYTYAGVFNGYGGSIGNYINWSKALVSVSGSFSGTASDGETYTGNISSPLVLNFNCTPMYTRYLYVSGVLNFTPTGKATRTINYGNGTCDLTYSVSIGAFSINITL